MAKITKNEEFLLEAEAALAFVRNVHGKAQFFVYLCLHGKRNGLAMEHKAYLGVSRRQALDAIRKSMVRRALEGSAMPDVVREVEIRTSAPYSENSPASVFIG